MALSSSVCSTSSTEPRMYPLSDVPFMYLCTLNFCCAQVSSTSFTPCIHTDSTVRNKDTGRQTKVLVYVEPLLYPGILLISFTSCVYTDNTMHKRGEKNSHTHKQADKQTKVSFMYLCLQNFWCAQVFSISSQNMHNIDKLKVSSHFFDDF